MPSNGTVSLEIPLGLALFLSATLAWSLVPGMMSGLVMLLSLGLVVLQVLSHYRRRHALQTQASLRTLREAFPDALLAVNADGALTYSKDARFPQAPLLDMLAPAGMLRPELTSLAHNVLTTPDGLSTNQAVLELGEYVLECRAFPLDDQEALVVARDITEAHTRNERMRYLATHDSLTGLLNRSSFMVVLEQAIARSRRTLKPFGLLFLDLNNFKKVNDTCGHAAGDVLLQKVAKRLAGNLRGSDSAYRLAGDEFTVIVEQLSSADDITLIVAKLRLALAQPYFEDLTAPAVSASIGAVSYPRDGDCASLLLDCADKAMYQDKASRR